MTTRVGKKALLLALSVVTMVVLAPAQSAVAYNGQGASDYAEYWWNKRNSNYPEYSQDCTNFVSQALHSGGGFSYVNAYLNTEDDHNWWAYWDYLGFETTASFIRVQDLYNFLLWRYPGGYPEGTAHTFNEQVYPYTPDAVVGGDVLFYDFDGTGFANGHAALQVTPITYEDSGSPDMRNGALYGNLVDEHTTDRHHAFWSLFTYNSRWATTTVYFMHISASNG